MLSTAAFTGWALGFTLLLREFLDVEESAHGILGDNDVSASEAAFSIRQGSALKVDTVPIRGAATAATYSWRVARSGSGEGLWPVREDYRLLRTASLAKGRLYEIFEDADHLRSVRIRSLTARAWLGSGSADPTPLVTMQLVDAQGMKVHGSAMLVDIRGAPWGPVEAQPLRLPEGWRGFVLVQGYACTPVHIRAPGLMRITLHPSAEIRVTISSEGLSLVGSRLALCVFGANVGSSTGRWLKLEGRTQVLLRGLRRGGTVGVELHSELRLFDIAREQVQLAQAVNKLEIVARAYATAHVHCSDPSLFGKTLYVAPFYAVDCDAGTLDYRYPWRAVEWDGSGWPISRLRAGSLDFWVWTEGGRFGRLGQRQFLAGSSGVALEARLDAKASATLRVSAHPLLGSRSLEVIVFDASYVGNPENLSGLRRTMPGLRLKTWTVQAGQTLRMDELWQRRSRVVIRSKEGATLWDGYLGLAKNPKAYLEATLALGALVRRKQPGPRGQHQGWRVFSKQTGEVVRYQRTEHDSRKLGSSALGLSKTLLLREGSYEIRPLNASTSTQAVQIVAGQIAWF